MNTRYSNEPASPPLRPLLPLLLLLFFGSGCAALIYEIVWFQMLQLVIGSSAVSLGVLVGTYMGGMCLGSVLLPRIISARRHPLRVYALLEFGIGLLGILILLGMPAAARIYSAHVGSGLTGILLRGLFASACLLPPTILMGATLPAIARWLESTPHGVSWLGFFYGGNIAGAVFGCLLAGFYLLRVHDSVFATYTAAGDQRVGRPGGGRPVRLEAVRNPRRSGRPAGQRRVRNSADHGYCAGRPNPAARRGVADLAGLRHDRDVRADGDRRGSGLDAAVIFDLGRDRVCLLHHSRRVSFRAGHRQQRRGGDRPQESAARNPARLVPVRLDGGDFLDGLYACRIAALLADRPVADQQCVAELSTGHGPLPVGPAAGDALVGASFPLALAAAARGQDPARLVGGVYAANTVGGILGGLGFSIILIPWIGTQHSQQLMIGLAGLAAFFTFVAFARHLWTRVSLAAIGGILGGSGFSILFIPWFRTLIGLAALAALAALLLFVVFHTASLGTSFAGYRGRNSVRLWLRH